MNIHFKKGDYIVIHDSRYEKDKEYRYNYVYKQRSEDYYLLTELDSGGSITNGWGIFKANNDHNWRYATQEEINEYELKGNPYDVSTLIKSDKNEDNIQLANLLKELSKI